MDTILYARCSTASQPAGQTDSTRYWRGLVAGQTGHARSDQTRPDRQTSVMLTCALFVGRAGERRTLAPLPQAPVLQVRS